MSFAAFEFYKVAYSDIEALQENVRGWDCRYDQIGNGRFTGALIYAAVGPVQFSQVHWTRKVLFRGKGPADAYCIEFPLGAQSAPRRFNGTGITKNDLIVGSPNKPAEFLPEGNRQSFVLAVSQDFFLATAAALSGCMVDPEGHPHGTVRVSDSTMSELRRSSQQCALIVRRHLETGGSEDVVARVADQIAKLLVLRISRACEDGQEPVRIQRSATLVAKAQELLDTREDPAMGLTEICHGLGISLRTLNYAFREATGEPPARWLRAKRLNSVRKRLLSEEGTKMLIKQVAFEHGFLHLGRFSGQYRRLFGELPTDTVEAKARLAPKTDRGATT